MTKFTKNHENVTDRSDVTESVIFDMFFMKFSDFRHFLDFPSGIG